MNAAERLINLLESARAYDRINPTAPTYIVWANALRESPSSPSFLATIAATDQVVVELSHQIKAVDPQVIPTIAPHIDTLHTALKYEALAQPWRTTTRSMGKDFDLALQFCKSTLDNRIHQRDLARDQIDFIREKLEDLRKDSVSLEPPTLAAYIVQSINDIEAALDRYWFLGPSHLAKISDSIVGTVGREISRHPAAPSNHVTLLKRLGAIASALATAVTLSLGVVQLDQATINALPWDGHQNTQIIECIMNPVNIGHDGLLSHKAIEPTKQHP